jgi:hypothetical protein
MRAQCSWYARALASGCCNLETVDGYWTFYGTRAWIINSSCRICKAFFYLPDPQVRRVHKSSLSLTTKAKYRANSRDGQRRKCPLSKRPWRATAKRRSKPSSLTAHWLLTRSSQRICWALTCWRLFVCTVPDWPQILQAGKIVDYLSFVSLLDSVIETRSEKIPICNLPLS